MKKQLIDPLFNRPKTKQKVVATQEKTVEVAGHSLVNTDICPSCRIGMKPYTANGIEAMACIPCRICLPKQD